MVAPGTLGLAFEDENVLTGLCPDCVAKSRQLSWTGFKLALLWSGREMMHGNPALHIVSQTE